MRLLAEKEVAAAETLAKAVEPLFGLVTVKTIEKTPYGEVVCRARNPLALKTLMRLLGIPSGPCRPPLGKMSRAGLDVVVRHRQARSGRESGAFRAPGRIFQR